MSKLTGAHLSPLAKAFKQGLAEGAITMAQAMEFCVDTYDAYLEQKVINAVKERARARPDRDTGGAGKGRERDAAGADLLLDSE